MANGAISGGNPRSYREDGYVLVNGMLDADEIGLLGRAAPEDRVLDQNYFVVTSIYDRGADF